MAGKCHPFGAGDAASTGAAGRAELELRFPSSPCNPLPSAFHFLSPQAINRSSVFDRCFKPLLCSVFFFPFKESLARIHPRQIHTWGEFVTHSPPPLCCCCAQPSTAHGRVGFELRQRPWQKKRRWDKEREMLTLRCSHGNIVLQSRRHICQGSEICHLIAWISMLWMRSHHTKSRSGLMP